MFKKLALLLIPIVAAPLALSAFHYDAQAMTPAYAEGETETPDESPYTYTEDTESGYDYYIRYYDECELLPKVNKVFCAPSGYTFYISYSDEQVDALLAEMDRCKADYDQRLIDCVFYYGLEGITVYSDSDPEWPDGREEAKDFIKNTVDGFQLFRIEELVEPTDLTFTFEFQFCAEETNYHFMFEHQPIHVEPYGENDFISIYARYYVRNGEHRINIFANLIDGFFFEDPDRNNYGFHTDETVAYYEGDTRLHAKYDITFFAHDTVPLGTIIRQDDGIESYYDKDDIDIKARLTFVSGGKTYTYWSQMVRVGDPQLHTVVDGYYDRDYIKRGEEHVFSLSYNHNLFNATNLMGGSAKITASPVVLSDPDYGHVYASQNDFPEVGQTGHYYYDMTDEEAENYVPGDSPYTTGYGDIYVWNQEDSFYEWYWGVDVIDIDFYYEDFCDPITGEASDADIEKLLENTTSLPFVGEWTFYYNVGFGGDGYSLGLSEYYGETLKVVRPNTTEEKIVLNVSDEVNMLAGGEQVEIIPTVSSYNENLLYYYDYELSNSSVVEITEGENGKLTLTPISAGVATLTLYMESVEFDKISKTIEIHVVDAIYDVSKIQTPNGVASAGEDLTFALNIRGLTGFQNLDIDWNVLDRNNESVPSSKLVDNKDASITIKQAEIGDYTISASYKGIELDTVTAQVRYQDSTVEPTEDTIVLNVPDTVNLLAGGEPVEIVSSVNPYNEGVEYYYDYSLSKDNVVNITKGNDGKVTVSPLASGVVTLTITVNYEPAHKLTKTISIRVIDAIYDVSKIVVPDEFHYAGKDLTASLNIRGFVGFQNLNLVWRVINKKGEELPEEQVVIHNDASMTIVNPDSDDYTITAYYEDVQLDSVTIQVRYVDVNKFLRINIWWIVLITLGFVAAVVFLMTVTKKGKTTVEHIERVYQVFCQCLSDDKLTKEELNRIKREINKCLHRCEDLNIDALNQYEKATRYLRKSLNDTKNLINSYDTLTAEERGILTERLDKDLAKALNVAKEIEAAKDLIEAYHTKANRQNYEVLKDETENTKKKK